MKIISKKGIIKKLKNSGISVSKIANIFDCCRKTIYNWINNENNKQKIGRKRKIQENMESKIISFIDSEILLNQNDIKDYIFKEFGIIIHQSNISRLLKRLNISYKKISKIYSEKKIDNQEWIKEFEIQNKNKRKMAMDECSFVMNESPRYGYASKSKRAYFKSPGNKGKRYSLILCISEDNKIINYELKTGNTNSLVIQGFFKKMENENGILILDNASYHKSKVVKESIKDHKFQNHFLPPYSPMLNPTEYCFGYIKHYIRKNRVRNFEDLKSIVEKSLSELTKNNRLNNFFKHCFSLKL